MFPGQPLPDGLNETRESLSKVAYLHSKLVLLAEDLIYLRRSLLFINSNPDTLIVTFMLFVI